MIDDDAFDHLRRPTVTRPLLGLTILAVEDSLYACDALRLMCLHSGARLRRADCLKSARRHLQVYRPSVVFIDLGLPDGNGAELIEDLSRSTPRVGVILACSGDPFAENVALAAGADGFLAKPIANLGAFQHAILQHLPNDARPSGLHPVRTDTIQPDAVAFREDMAFAAEILAGPLDLQAISYVTSFVRGVAMAAEDHLLEHAAADLALAQSKGLPIHGPMSRLARLAETRVQDAVAI